MAALDEGFLRDLRSFGEGKRRRRSPQQIEPCSVKGCERDPSEHKPYCSDHLDNLPTYREARDAAEGARRELVRSSAHKSAWSTIDVAGPVASDVIAALALGARTIRRLRIASDFAAWSEFAELEPEASERAWENYLRALEEARLVTRVIRGSRRGTPFLVIDLVARPAALADDSTELEDAA